MQKYYLYIDECGDHNLKNYDPAFPIFTLCGILVTQENRKSLVKAFENLKKDFFRNNGYCNPLCGYKKMERFIFDIGG